MREANHRAPTERSGAISTTSPSMMPSTSPGCAAARPGQRLASRPPPARATGCLRPPRPWRRRPRPSGAPGRARRARPGSAAPTRVGTTRPPARRGARWPPPARPRRRAPASPGSEHDVRAPGAGQRLGERASSASADRGRRRAARSSTAAPAVAGQPADSGPHDHQRARPGRGRTGRARVGRRTGPRRSGAAGPPATPASTAAPMSVAVHVDVPDRCRPGPSPTTATAVAQPVSCGAEGGDPASSDASSRYITS